MKIAILGAGGVGGFLAAALDRAGSQVVVVARESTPRRLALESVLLGNFSATPKFVTLLEEPVDALIVATKAGGLEPGLERIVSTPPLVVPLLNGLDHMRVLRARFGERAAAATIRIEADRPQPGRIVQTSRFLRVDIAARPATEALAEALRDAGVPVELLTSDAQILWGKLVRLNALALTTSAWNLPLGAIRSDPDRRSTLEALICEGARVAAADGASVDPAVVIGELDAAHDSLGSSMQRDIAAGREPELDAIAGAVLRAGRAHGLDCPTVAGLAALVAARVTVARPASP